MKKISLIVLSCFQGLISEYPKTFLFEFNVLCHSMDYSTDAQNLRLFPNTLKIFTLQWFMGLPEKCITTWEGMR